MLTLFSRYKSSRGLRGNLCSRFHNKSCESNISLGVISKLLDACCSEVNGFCLVYAMCCCLHICLYLTEKVNKAKNIALKILSSVLFFSLSSLRFPCVFCESVSAEKMSKMYHKPCYLWTTTE